MIKSYKIRLYPTKEQEALMWKHIGACRYIWNYMLAYQQEQYVNGEKHLSAFDMIKLLTPLKKDGEHEWLCEVSNASLGVVCRDLDKAYKGFFKKIARFPKFKSRKRSKKTYPVKDDRIYFINSKLMHIEKVGKIKYKTDFDLPQGRGHKFTNPRISNVNGKWMLSFGMECENQAPVLTDISMGIDLGVKDLAIAEFNGTKITYAYGLPFDDNYTVRGTSNIIYYNDGSCRELMKPHITITLNAGCTEFSIDNKTTGKKFELSGLPGDAMTIDVDNENCIMSERTGSVNIYNYFNFNFVGLASGDNEMIITGDADVRIQGRFLYNVGA